jgi:hypothetical protein
VKKRLQWAIQHKYVDWNQVVFYRWEFISYETSNKTCMEKAWWKILCLNN